MSDQIRSGVYTIVNTETGDCYIGSSVDIGKRIRAHKFLLRIGKHHASALQTAWNQYGEDAFLFDILEIIPDISKLAIVEQNYLDQRTPLYNSARIALNTATNLCTGKKIRGISDSEWGKLLRERWYAYNPDEVIRESLKMADISDPVMGAIARLYAKESFFRKLREDLEHHALALHRDFIATTGELTVLQSRILLYGLVRLYSDFLAEVVTDAGIITQEDFAEYFDNVWLGLYDKRYRELQKHRGLKKGETPLDYMGPEESVLKLMHVQQSRAKTERDKPDTPLAANQIPLQVGRVFRRALEEIGATMPEDLPKVEHIDIARRAEARRLKDEARQRKIEEEDRLGLWAQLQAPSKDDPHDSQ